MRFIGVAVILSLLVACTQERVADLRNELSDEQIQSELARHVAIVDELSQKSLGRFGEAKKELKEVDSFLRESRTSHFPLDDETEVAVASTARFKQSSEFAKVTVQLYEELEVLEKLREANRVGDPFLQLVARVEAQIELNQEIIATLSD